MANTNVMGPVQRREFLATLKGARDDQKINIQELVTSYIVEFGSHAPPAFDAIRSVLEQEGVSDILSADYVLSCWYYHHVKDDVAYKVMKGIGLHILKDDGVPLMPLEHEVTAFVRNFRRTLEVTLEGLTDTKSKCSVQTALHTLDTLSFRDVVRMWITCQTYGVAPFRTFETPTIAH